MEKKTYILYGLVVIIVVALGFAIRRANQQPGDYDGFAQCLAESGAKMYSAWWCGHCQEQKRWFGKSFEVFDESGGHVECSPGGIKTFSDFCKKVDGFSGTPYWIMGDGEQLRGKQPLEILAQKSGCEL